MGQGYKVAEPSAGQRWTQISWSSDEPDDRGQLILVQWLVLVPAAVDIYRQRYHGYVDYLQNCFIKRSDKIFRHGFYFMALPEWPEQLPVVLVLLDLRAPFDTDKPLHPSLYPLWRVHCWKVQLAWIWTIVSCFDYCNALARVIQHVWWSLFKWSIMSQCIWSVTNRSRPTSPHCWSSSLGYHKSLMLAFRLLARSTPSRSNNLLWALLWWALSGKAICNPNYFLTLISNSGTTSRALSGLGQPCRPLKSSWIHSNSKSTCTPKSTISPHFLSSYIPLPSLSIALPC